ncbi:Hint domain-containing protein [Salinihabitans flavidus]|uniref:Hint domain-containing protein n=1 Tax=Salinihabitans flavidus TaxID=569882 RepID=A0A1H8LNZ0_9RHOB|nr:Hint domain-containing protein [Salinihabitans flavidus]SEO06556.1 Hint domain-containing protein [Salinihabitans flavidus]
MTWIALADHLGGCFGPRGISAGPGPAADEVMPKGSLLVETRLSPGRRPQRLLGHRRPHPWASGLALYAVPGGGIVLVLSRGRKVFHATLNHDAEERADVIRVTYSWDMHAGGGRLVIERPELSKAFIVRVEDPMPLMQSDVREMAAAPGGCEMDPDLVFFAVSDTVEPIGPMPALSPDVPIATPQGYRTAGDLRRGDMVTTLDGAAVPVLQVVERRVPARGSFRPVRLRHPYFGLQSDVFVAPGQRLVIGGSQVEYMFGREHVLVPARHLVNGTAALQEPPGLEMRYVHFLLPDHEAVIAAGTAIESLNIGRIRRKPELLSASLLAGFDRATLPDHSVTAFPILRPFEAVTLAEARAA